MNSYPYINVDNLFHLDFELHYFYFILFYFDYFYRPACPTVHSSGFVSNRPSIRSFIYLPTLGFLKLLLQILGADSLLQSNKKSVQTYVLNCRPVLWLTCSPHFSQLKFCLLDYLRKMLLTQTFLDTSRMWFQDNLKGILFV